VIDNPNPKEYAGFNNKINQGTAVNFAQHRYEIFIQSCGQNQGNYRNLTSKFRHNLIKYTFDLIKKNLTTGIKNY
jgi:hypothetical protein